MKKPMNLKMPCLKIASSVKNTNMNDAITNVTMIWLVGVNEYGVMPSKLHSSTNMNSEKINGKNLRPASPALSLIKLSINSYDSSTIDCMRLGTSTAFFVPSAISNNTAATARLM